MRPAPIKQRSDSGALIWRAAIAVVLSLALMLVSFGHRPLQAEAQTTAYILAGGDIADICADGDGPHHAADICAACVISQGVMLAEKPAHCRPAILPGLVQWQHHAADLHDHGIALRHPARAPPVRDQSFHI